MINGYQLDYVEIFAPMAKPLAYWHVHALGFTMSACSDGHTNRPGISSYLLTSGGIKLLLTSAYPTAQQGADSEIASFISRNYCGVRRFALQVTSVKDAFETSISGGGIPIKFPTRTEDEWGYVEEASIRLYDDREILFINRAGYRGCFRPGFRSCMTEGGAETEKSLIAFDHIAAEVRINESAYWTDYLSRTIGTMLTQSVRPGEDNKTGMILNISQSEDKKLTLVIAEPESCSGHSKVQKNIDLFGPGIHPPGVCNG